MIGTNNHMSSPPEVTAHDIRLIVRKLRTKLPETKVLVLGIFPRGGDDNDGARQINMKVNRLIEDIGDGRGCTTRTLAKRSSTAVAYGAT